jgi:hypothetical protein
MVVAAELAVGVAGDAAEQEVALDIAGAGGLAEEVAGEPSGADREGQTDEPPYLSQHRSNAP